VFWLRNSLCVLTKDSTAFGGLPPAESTYGLGWIVLYAILRIFLINQRSSGWRTAPQPVVYKSIVQTGRRQRSKRSPRTSGAFQMSKKLTKVKNPGRNTERQTSEQGAIGTVREKACEREESRGITVYIVVLCIDDCMTTSVEFPVTRRRSVRCETFPMRRDNHENPLFKRRPVLLFDRIPVAGFWSLGRFAGVRRRSDDALALACTGL